MQRKISKAWIFAGYFAMALTLTLVVTGCSSFLYYPSRALYVNVSKLTPPPEDHEFESDGIKIHGWYFRAQDKAHPGESKGVILFFHGNGQNRSSHFISLYWLVTKGYDLAIFDYPGYGQTAGSPSPKNTVRMARDAIQYVHKMDPKKKFIVYGHSLGGAIAMRAVWEERKSVRPYVFVVDSTFLSYQKAARKILSKSAWTWLLQPFAWLFLSDKWAPGDRVGDLDGIPIIVAHSRGDEIIPFTLGEEVFAKAHEPKQFWPRDKVSHNGIYDGPDAEAMKQKLLQALQ
jgi:pimeloyl-ACP methyl ester carboxylesterase